MNAPVQCSSVDEPAQLLGVDPRREHVVAPHQERRQGGHEGGHVEQGPAVEVHVVGARPPGSGRCSDALDHERPVGEQGAVGAPGEGGGVHHEHRRRARRSRRRDRGRRRWRGTPRTPPSPVDVVADPQRLRARCRLACLAPGCRRSRPPGRTPRRDRCRRSRRRTRPRSGASWRGRTRRRSWPPPAAPRAGGGSSGRATAAGRRLPTPSAASALASWLTRPSSAW